MKHLRFCSMGIVLLGSLMICGCGDSEPKVIQHTDDYQLTEQEQANKKAEEEARKGR